MTDSAADPSGLDERAFERLLLDSARDDAPAPDHTEQAWQRFARASGALAAAAAVSAGGPAVASGSSGRAALRFGALGALGGGALVAAWFGLSAPRAPAVPVPVTVAMSAPPAATGAVRLPSPPAASVLVPEAPTPPAHTQPGPRAGAAAGRSAAKSERAAQAKSPDSGLAAEIALLDAARIAIGIGAYDRALGLIEQHRHEHPRGMLLRDAEVLKLETLLERGNRTEASLRAEAFLERYPEDPHAARVREIAASTRAAAATP